MSLLKPKIFLPLCVAGILTGYMAAEYIVPKYFHPTPETKLTRQDIIAAIGAQPYYFRQTTSGSYLAGQFAQRHKDWNKASEYIGRVLRDDKSDPDFQKHSMILSMAAGDTKTSIALAQDVLKNDSTDLLAILFSSVGQLKESNYQEAINIFDKMGQNNIASFIIPALKMWAQAGLKTFELNNIPSNSFYSYHALLAGNHLDKKDEALNFAQKAFTIEENDIRDLEKHADAFLSFGDVEKALSIYQAIDKQNFADADIKKKIENLENNIAFEENVTLPSINTPQDGAALVFQNMAEILLREQSDDSATIFAQMALALNPKLHRSHAFIAEVYKRYDRYDEAIETLQKIDTNSDLYPDVQRQIADLYVEQEKNDMAIQVLEKLHQTNDNLNALIQIGDIHRYEENYSDAEKFYTTVIDKPETTLKDYWYVYYARGMARERLKEFENADDDLQQALTIEPNNPYLLNYLGYSWADRDIKFDESLDMIIKAVTLKPDDGYITDSLGWVHYKMENFDLAVPALERAVELLPYDPTINDHLGDAYWQVNRKNEAKFQWQRALNYNEDEDLELKEQIQKKLSSGLPKIKVSQTKTDEQKDL